MTAPLQQTGFYFVQQTTTMLIYIAFKNGNKRKVEKKS